MPRLCAIFFAFTLAVVLSTTSWSQQAQTGQANTVGPTNQAAATSSSGNPGTTIPAAPSAANTFPGPFSGPNASSAAQAAMPGQSGTVSGFGPVGLGQPQFGAGGPLATGGQFTPGGAAVDRFNRTFGNFNAGVFIAPTPWFSGLALRRQLQLSDLQFDQLNRAYSDSWNRFNQAVASIPSTLALAERARQLQALQNSFYGDFNSAVEATLTDPALRQRFNKFNLQFQNDGVQSQLPMQPNSSLKPEQQRRLRPMANQWNQQMTLLRQRTAADSSVSVKEFNDLRLQAGQQIEAVLTPDQMANWPQLIGPYYEFPWELYALTNSADFHTVFRPSEGPQIPPRPAEAPASHP